MEEYRPIIHTSPLPTDTNLQPFRVHTFLTSPEPNRPLSRRKNEHPDCGPKHLPLKARNPSISHDRSHQELCYLASSHGILCLACAGPPGRELSPRDGFELFLRRIWKIWWIIYLFIYLFIWKEFFFLILKILENFENFKQNKIKLNYFLSFCRCSARSPPGQ